MPTKRKYDDLDNAKYRVSRSVAACLTLTSCDLRLAKEEELRGALTKAEDLEKENLDLMTKLSEKEQECDVRTQERDDLTSSLSRLQEKFETESMGKGTVEVERWPEFFQFVTASAEGVFNPSLSPWCTTHNSQKRMRRLQ